MRYIVSSPWSESGANYSVTPPFSPLQLAPAAVDAPTRVPTPRTKNRPGCLGSRGGSVDGLGSVAGLVGRGHEPSEHPPLDVGETAIEERAGPGSAHPPERGVVVEALHHTVQCLPGGEVAGVAGTVGPELREPGAPG